LASHSKGMKLIMSVGKYVFSCYWTYDTYNYVELETQVL